MLNGSSAHSIPALAPYIALVILLRKACFAVALLFLLRCIVTDVCAFCSFWSSGSLYFSILFRHSLFSPLHSHHLRGWFLLYFDAVVKNMNGKSVTYLDIKQIM